MSVCKRKDGRWQVNYRDERGKPTSKTFPKGKAGKNKAAAFDAQIRYNKATNQPLPQSPRHGIYLDDLCQEWVDAKKAQGRKTQWISDWVHIFNAYLSEPLCRRPAAYITQADVLSIVGAHWSESSQSTRNRYIGYLKAIFQHGVEQGHIDKNPLRTWVKGKEDRRRSRLTLEDLRKVQAEAGKEKSRCSHLAWAIDVAWHIPCRPGKDLYGLTYAGNIRRDKGGAEVCHSKVRRHVFVKLPEEFLWELTARERKSISGHLIEYKGKPVDRLDSSLAGCARRIKLPYRPTMYDIRHLWITTALDRGLEPSAIAHLAGTSVEMIHSNYYEPHQAEAGRAVEIMPDIRDRKSGKVIPIQNKK